MDQTAPTTPHQPEEFRDYAGEAPQLGLKVKREQVLNSTTIKGLIAFAAGMFILTGPGLGEKGPLARTVGVLLILVAAVDLPRLLGERPRPARWGVDLMLRLGGLAAGIFLIAWPRTTSEILAWVIGIGLVGSGLGDGYRALSARAAGDSWTWPAARGAFKAVLGITVVASPQGAAEVVIVLVAIVWALAGLLTVITNLERPSRKVEVRDTWKVFLAWLDGRAGTAGDRRQLYEQVFLEGEPAKRRLSRFFVLMGFATIIATYGVISDSTAVVVGAMLIAPLMTPLMGLSASMIMGWPRRAAISAQTAGLAILLAIGLSLLMAKGLPFDVAIEGNSQILSRVNPTLIDLAIALAAGGAGAFALSRPDVSAALPGVAVAIALVPPLTVVGITLEAGAYGDAAGALLLFGTNAVAILLAGAVVFVLTGFTPLRRILENREWIRTALTSVAILAVVIVGVLGVSTTRLVTNDFAVADANDAAEEWAQGTPQLNVFSVIVDGSDIEVVVVGPNEPRTADPLAEDLATELSRDIELTVRWVPERVFVSSAGG